MKNVSFFNHMETIIFFGFLFLTSYQLFLFITSETNCAVKLARDFH